MKGVETVVRAGDALQHDEAFLRSLVDGAAAGLLTVDEDDTVVFANPAMGRLLGYDHADLVGSSTRRILPERFQSLHVVGSGLHHGSAEENLGRPREDLSMVHRDGHEIPVSVALQEHEYDGDRLVTAVVTDAAERRRREERLRERNRELAEFADVLAHDLRNPLTVAEGYLDLAQTSGGDEELRQVEDAIDRMHQIIDDALAQARHGRVDGSTEVLPFGDVMRAAWDAVPTADAELVLPEASWRIRADESRLRQLVENLIRNAVEHGSTSNRPSADDAVEHGSTSPGSQTRQDAAEHGSTSPRSQTHEDAVEYAGTTATVRIGVLAAGYGFYVEDDGPGLPEALKAPGETSMGTDRDGDAGYGLRIVETVADEHGWDLRLTDSPSGGARIEFHGARVFER